MRIVVADTGPLNYLVLIGAIGVLPKLFDQVLAPQAVFDELTDRDTPPPTRAWVTQAPDWFTIHPDPAQTGHDETTAALDVGERAAIALAVALKADLVLMDDRDGVIVARAKGLAATGTLGVLDLAARRGLIDLAEAVARLKATSFYYRQGLIDALLARHDGKT